MTELDGVRLPGLPVTDLEHVRDLIYFDGPLLSHWQHPNGDDYLYYWVDCDSDANRWMVLRVGEASVLRLVNRFLPLDNVIPDACRDGFVYFVDTHQDHTETVHLVTRENIPPDYLPELGVFLDAQPTHDERSYSVIVEGGWTAKALGQFPGTFAKVYSVLYGLNTLRLPSFEQFPWRGGFSALHFYNWISARVPSEDRPIVSAMQYASPGFMRFSVKGSVADGVGQCVSDYKANNAQIAGAYADISQYIRKHDLNQVLEPDAPDWSKHSEALSNQAKALLAGFSIIDEARFATAAGRPFEAAKIAMSFYRRIRDLSEFEKEGMVRFPKSLVNQ